MVMSDDKASATFRYESLRGAFYAECSDEDVALARLLLQPEPMMPLATPVRIDRGNFGRVPRVYIECLRDQRGHTATAATDVAAVPCEQVLSIDTDHSPFFSRPDELVSLLNTL